MYYFGYVVESIGKFCLISGGFKYEFLVVMI